MQEIYQSSVNDRLNELMKILTVIATIFIVNFLGQCIRDELRYTKSKPLGDA